jgi:hypothetical protein
MLDPASHARLDRRLQTLLHILWKPDADPDVFIYKIIQSVTAKGKPIDETYEGKPVNPPRWEVTEADAPHRRLIRPDWERHARLASAWFYGPVFMDEEGEGSRALYKVFATMVRIVRAETGYRKQRLKKRLQRRIEDYLSLRGKDVAEPRMEAASLVINWPASAPDLAKALGLNPVAVESWLRRYRKRYPDCFITVADDERLRNEPKYLHQEEVLPHLKRHFNKESENDGR